MDPNNFQAPNTTPVPPPPPGTPPVMGAAKGSYGAVIAIVVIVAIVIVGAFYVWGEKISGDRYSPENTGASEAGPTLSDSNDLGDIEADLAATSLVGADAGLSAAEQHIQENQ